jgi:hypothetical protein
MNMETKEVKLYVQAVKWSWEKDFKIGVGICQGKSDKDRCVVDLSEVTVDVQIPTVDHKQLTLAEVEQLHAIIKTERADSYARITAIEEKIQSLLCIEQGE